MLDEQILSLITKCRNIIRTIDDKLEQKKFKEELEGILTEYTKEIKAFKNDKSILKFETEEGIQTKYIIKLDAITEKLKKYEAIYFIKSNCERINNSLLKECDENEINRLKETFKVIINGYENIKLKLEFEEKEAIVKKVYSTLLNLIIAEVKLKNNSDLLAHITDDNRCYLQQALIDKLLKVRAEYNIEIDKNFDVLSSDELLDIIKELINLTDNINELNDSTIKDENQVYEDAKKNSIFERIKKYFTNNSEFFVRENEHKTNEQKSISKITPAEFEKATGIKINDHDKLVNYDISMVDFTDYDIKYLNLSNTNAHIDPQKVIDKSLYSCNLEGLNLNEADFTDVNISASNLRHTNAHIDPQKVLRKILCFCNLEGLDLGKVDFTDVYIVGANLKNTGAKIDPQKIRDHNFNACNLEGLDFLNANFRVHYPDHCVSAYLNNTNFTNCKNLDTAKFYYSYEELVEKYHVILPKYIMQGINPTMKGRL